MPILVIESIFDEVERLEKFKKVLKQMYEEGLV